MISTFLDACCQVRKKSRIPIKILLPTCFYLIFLMQASQYAGAALSPSFDVTEELKQRMNQVKKIEINSAVVKISQRFSEKVPIFIGVHIYCLSISYCQDVQSRARCIEKDNFLVVILQKRNPHTCKIFIFPHFLKGNISLEKLKSSKQVRNKINLIQSQTWKYSN